MDELRQVISHEKAWKLVNTEYKKLRGILVTIRNMKNILIWLLIVLTSGYTVYVLTYIHKKNALAAMSVTSSIATTSNSQIESITVQVSTSTEATSSDFSVATTTDCSLNKGGSRQSFSGLLHDDTILIKKHDTLIFDTNKDITVLESEGYDVSELKKQLKAFSLTSDEYMSCVSEYDALTIKEKNITGYSETSCSLGKTCLQKFNDLALIVQGIPALYTATLAREKNSTQVNSQKTAYKCAIAQKTPNEYIQSSQVTKGLDDMLIAQEGVKDMLKDKGVDTKVLESKIKIYSDVVSKGKTCISKFKGMSTENTFTKDLCTTALECNDDFKNAANFGIAAQAELINLFPVFTNAETIMISNKYPVLFK